MELSTKNKNGDKVNTLVFKNDFDTIHESYNQPHLLTNSFTNSSKNSLELDSNWKNNKDLYLILPTDDRLIFQSQQRLEYDEHVNKINRNNNK